MKMRIKSFTSQKEKSLDEKVNDWLKKNSAIEIVDIQSSVICVSYHKTKFFVTTNLGSKKRKFMKHCESFFHFVKIIQKNLAKIYILVYTIIKEMLR